MIYDCICSLNYSSHSRPKIQLAPNNTFTLKKTKTPKKTKKTQKNQTCSRKKDRPSKQANKHEQEQEATKRKHKTHHSVNLIDANSDHVSFPASFPHMATTTKTCFQRRNWHRLCHTSRHGQTKSSKMVAVKSFNAVSNNRV